MTTHDTDRGAYAPHSDAPLAFDARRPSDRRPLPMTLIASAVVLVVIAGALVMAYRGGVRGAESPKPVGEPVGVIKTAAPPEGAAEDPSARLDVYAAQNVPSSAPNFAPPPEQPAPRPAPVTAAPAPAPQLQVRTVEAAKMRIEPPEPAVTAAPVVTSVQRTAAATSSTAVTPGAADRAAPTRPVQLAAARPAPLPAVVVPKTVAAAPAATVPVVAAKTGGPAAVQIGAFSSKALADQGFADAARLVGGRMAGHGRSVETVERDGKTFHRATLGGFADRAAAKAFCDALAAKGGRCLVKS